GGGRGQGVLSAGEVPFRLAPEGVAVAHVPNQWTGSWPEPESWPAVAAALGRAGLAAPEGFSVALLFRRCAGCGSTNIVKDGCFECAVCGVALPHVWNFG